MKSSVLWVIQRNLGNQDDHGRIITTCKADGHDALYIDVIPFSPTLPDVPTDRPTIFYGGTNFIASISRSGLWKPGAFCDDEAFHYSRYLKEYGQKMLNANAVMTTLDQFDPYATGLNPNDLIFLRPDKDLKEFAGTVLSVANFAQWRAKILTSESDFDRSCPIIVSEPVGIAHEWRTFIVNGQVVAGSHYRSYHRLDIQPDLPDRVKNFAEEMAAIWSPAPVFTLDVAQSGPELWVLELGSFNSSGFYAASMEEIVKAVNSYVCQALL